MSNHQEVGMNPKAAILLAIFSLAVVPVFADYNFDLFCRTDTIQQVPPTGIGYFTFTLTNTGAEPDVYELNCIVIQTVPDWSIIYCMRGQCLEPGNPMYDSLLSGERDTTVEIKVFTTFTPGEAVAVLTVISLGNPSLSKSITTITKLANGIEEGKKPFANLSSGQSHCFVSRSQPFFFKGRSGSLFAVNGKVMLKLKAGANDLGGLNAGVYLLQEGKERHKLVLF